MPGLRSVFSLMLCVSCLEPYTPQVSFDSRNLMVVDGFINADGQAIVKLSRSLPLGVDGINPKETGAAVPRRSTNTARLLVT